MLVKLKTPLRSTLRISPPLFVNTKPLPVKPDTTPPTVKSGAVTQFTVMLVTFAVAVPVPLATVQVWPTGGVNTETL